MMRLSYSQIDLQACFAAKEAPVDVIAKASAADLWYIAAEPIEMKRSVRWALCRSGPHLRVPLVPYRTAATAPLLFAFAVSVGVHAAADLLSQRLRPIGMHIAVGNTVEDLREEGVEAFRAYLGLAIHVQRLQ